MYFSVLGSGSKGNSVYIESGTTKILIDAGFSGKEMAARLQTIGRRIEDLDALFVTHEHHDHIHGIGVLSRRYDIPVYSNYGTLKTGEKLLGRLFRHCEFGTGETFEMQDFEIRTFSVSHDAAEPVGFIISNGNMTIAYCTDTGTVSRLLQQRLIGCHALILEFNYDLKMLKNGPYPLSLQQRVSSRHGHLANEAGANFLQSLLHQQLKYVILAHLSAVNNHPDLALNAARNVIGELPIQLRVASQIVATELISLRS